EYATMSDFIEVTTTVSTEEEAYKMTRSIVENRLAACGQVIGPIASIYWWQGSIEKGKEWLCVFKTSKDSYDHLEKAIKDLHSYKVPQILSFEIREGYKDYLKWVNSSIKVKKGKSKEV
ncbi:MAG: divalent-cation tolerance protein CutA, partial [Conexivisphaerales archaeon]